MTSWVEAKKGRPNYYVVLSYMDHGKQIRKWVTTDIPVTGNNKRKANARAKELLAEYERQKTDITSDPLFTEYLGGWLESIRHSIAASTYECYELTLRVHIIPFFEPLRLKVKDVTPTHVQKYVTEKMRKVSANTVRKHLANISKCLNSAVKQNIIAFNPVDRIDKPKKKTYTGAQHYNEENIKKLLDCSKGDPLEIVILLTLFYGLRRSEVLGLKWSAINTKEDTIAIRHTVVEFSKEIHYVDSTKNRSSCSVVPLTENIKAQLKRWRKTQQENKILQPNDYHDSDYVCTQLDGSLIRPNYVTQHFLWLLKKNGLPRIRFHDLRHSSAGYLKSLGFDLKDIQVWLRHKDIQTTMNIYVNLDMDDKKNIARNLNERLFAN